MTQVKVGMGHWVLGGIEILTLISSRMKGRDYIGQTKSIREKVTERVMNMTRWQERWSQVMDLYEKSVKTCRRSLVIPTT